MSVLQTVRVTDDSTAGNQLVTQLVDQTAPSRYWPGDDEFIAGVLQPNIYRVLLGPRLRVLLGGIETALRQDKSELHFVPEQVSKLSVEHLLPQKWSQFYPLPTDRPSDEAETRRQLSVHKLGNLTLTTTKLNSSISNGSWPTKRTELNKHTVMLLTAGSVLQAPPGVSAQIAMTWQDTWEEDRIELRTLYLATIACEAWPGPGDDHRDDAADRIRSKVASAQAEIDALITHRVAEGRAGISPSVEPEASSVARRAVDLALESGAARGTSAAGSSGESYTGPRRSIARHIVEAFDEHPDGTFLTISEIRAYESTEYGADLPSAGAINYQLKLATWDASGLGIVPGYGGTRNVFGATKTS